MCCTHAAGDRCKSIVDNDMYNNILLLLLSLRLIYIFGANLMILYASLYRDIVLLPCTTAAAVALYLLWYYCVRPEKVCSDSVARVFSDSDTRGAIAAAAASKLSRQRFVPEHVRDGSRVKRSLYFRYISAESTRFSQLVNINAPAERRAIS